MSEAAVQMKPKWPAMSLKEAHARINFFPEGGGESLTNLRSDRRLNLIIDTNVRMAQGYGEWKQGQDPAILDQWPAQELYRAMARKVPRDWIARWREAGGQFFGGRMIALKNSSVWTRISRFGLPYAPFDFQSGMETRDVDRDAAVEIGLIDRDTRIAPDDRGFNDDLKFTPEVRDRALRQALLESDPELFFDGDVLKVRKAA